MRPFLYLFLFILISCSNNQSGVKKALPDTLPTNRPASAGQSLGMDTMKENRKTFPPIAAFPRINDTCDFIKQLKTFAELELCALNGDPKFKERISCYRKIKLNGSDKEYILCEYSYGSGCNTGFPWKYQLLFTPKGKLMATLSAFGFRLLKVFSGQNPFLLVLVSSAKGNGGHQLFKMSDDTLENVYEGYINYQTETYDAHEDNAVYEPNELKVAVEDVDKDGFNDLVFRGNLVLIQGLTKDSVWYDYEIRRKDTITYSINHPFKKLPVQYVYLYNPKDGHFVENEKYSIKYSIE